MKHCSVLLHNLSLQYMISSIIKLLIPVLFLKPIFQKDFVINMYFKVPKKIHITYSYT